MVAIAGLLTAPDTGCVFDRVPYLRELDDWDATPLRVEHFAESRIPETFFEVRFRGSEARVRAKGIVGIVPVRCALCGTTHVVSIYPKGVPRDAT